MESIFLARRIRTNARFVRPPQDDLRTTNDYLGGFLAACECAIAATAA
jgi:hypothetical protein